MSMNMIIMLKMEYKMRSNENNQNFRFPRHKLWFSWRDEVWIRKYIGMSLISSNCNREVWRNSNTAFHQIFLKYGKLFECGNSDPVHLFCHQPLGPVIMATSLYQSASSSGPLPIHDRSSETRSNHPDCGATIVDGHFTPGWCGCCRK